MEEKNPPCIGFTRACAEAETEALKGERPGDDRCAAGDDRRATVGRFATGGIFAGSSSQGTNNEIRADFVNKSLENSQFVSAGDRGQGFVFCPNEEPLQALALRVDGMIDDDAQDVELPFPATRAYPQ